MVHCFLFSSTFVSLPAAAKESGYVGDKHVGDKSHVGDILVDVGDGHVGDQSCWWRIMLVTIVTNIEYVTNMTVTNIDQNVTNITEKSHNAQKPKKLTKHTKKGGHEKRGYKGNIIRVKEK